MRATPIGTRLVLPMLAAAAVACFGSPDFGNARATAVDFAKALQAGDTGRMRTLSIGIDEAELADFSSRVPAAYTAFADPERSLVTVEGGGIYGSGPVFVFRVPSTRLTACSGGVELSVLRLGRRERVTGVRLVPGVGSAADAQCRDGARSPSATSP
jgi:hypothetical protein